MREADIPFALAIQSESYPPTHIESEAVFRLRLESAPHTAWIAEDRGNIMAYLVAYPSLYGKIPPWVLACCVDQVSGYGLALLNSEAQGDGLTKLNLINRMPLILHRNV